MDIHGLSPTYQNFHQLIPRIFTNLAPKIFTNLSPRIFTSLFLHLCHGLPRGTLRGAAMGWPPFGYSTWMRLRGAPMAACRPTTCGRGHRMCHLEKLGGKNWVNIKTWVECNELYFSPIVSVEHDRTKQQSMNPWGFVPSKHWGFASIFPHRIQVFDLAAGRGRLQH